jgi:hypothetical protein
MVSKIREGAESCDLASLPPNKGQDRGAENVLPILANGKYDVDGQEETCKQYANDHGRQDDSLQ